MSDQYDGPAMAQHIYRLREQIARDTAEIEQLKAERDALLAERDAAVKEADKWRERALRFADGGPMLIHAARSEK